MKPTLRDIQPVMDGFNFDEVQQIMAFMEWHWFAHGRTPTVQELKDKAYYLLKMVIEEGDGKKDFSAGGGGLKAWVCEDDFGLEFIAMECSSFYDSEIGERMVDHSSEEE